MPLYSGGPFLVDSFMADNDIIPPPDPVPVPAPTHSSHSDEEDTPMFVAVVGAKLVAAGAETKTSTVPRTTDSSLNTVARQRHSHVEIDVELSASGVVEMYWDTAPTSKVYILTGRKQQAAIPAGATEVAVVFPGAGTATVAFGRVE